MQCGFATVHDVRTRELEDRMESFFLSETMKYLYLVSGRLFLNDSEVICRDGEALLIYGPYLDFALIVRKEYRSLATF